MVSTKGILSIVVALAVALGVIFIIDQFITKKGFDPTKTVIDIVIIGIALTIAGMVSSKIVGKKGISAPKINV